MKNNTYEIHYDEGADFLEIYFGEPSKCITNEIEEGVFVRKDQETSEVKSVEILSFKKRGSNVLENTLSKFNIKLPLDIKV